MSSVNTGLSIGIALKLKGKSQKWLSVKTGIPANSISKMSRSKSATLFTVECICTALEMKVSEFIALGETSNEA
jgi:DNA-binding Xre family transcriptional regulator